MAGCPPTDWAFTREMIVIGLYREIHYLCKVDVLGGLSSGERGVKSRLLGGCRISESYVCVWEGGGGGPGNC